MKRRAFMDHGAPGLPRTFPRPNRSGGGFTLLEMCTVLIIIALLVGVSIPSMESAMTEKAIRDDTGQLALMVKTAMIQSADQHRVYVIDLTSSSIALHPAGYIPNAEETASSDTPSDASSNTDDDSNKNPQSRNFVVNGQFNPPNRLQVRDPDKPGGWTDMPSTEWIFKPGELCPASRVHLSRGDAWLEMSFNALTGNVENEAAYIP